MRNRVRTEILSGGIWLRPLWWALHCNGHIQTLPVCSSPSRNKKKAILTVERMSCSLPYRLTWSFNRFIHLAFFTCRPRSLQLCICTQLASLFILITQKCERPVY